MPRWMMKFAIEAHLGLKEGLPKLVFTHPEGAYSAHLQNADVRRGIALPLLHAYMIYEADNIDIAPDVGERHLRNFLDTLTFCTGSRFQMHQRLALFDWSPGVAERHGRIYSTNPDPNVPQLTATFLHYRIEPTAFVSFTSPEGREVVFADIPQLQMDLGVVRTPRQP